MGANKKISILTFFILDLFISCFLIFFFNFCVVELSRLVFSLEATDQVVECILTHAVGEGQVGLVFALRMPASWGVLGVIGISFLFCGLAAKIINKKPFSKFLFFIFSIYFLFVLYLAVTFLSNTILWGGIDFSKDPIELFLAEKTTAFFALFVIKEIPFSFSFLIMLVNSTYMIKLTLKRPYVKRDFGTFLALLLINLFVIPLTVFILYNIKGFAVIRYIILFLLLVIISSFLLITYELIKAFRGNKL